jgi:hypothetical protein
VAAVEKALRNVEIKDAAKGHVSAVFATLDVVDKDGDVTVKGAFNEGQKVAISNFGHKIWEGAPPVGKGVIREVGNEAVFEGQFFMNTTHGRDAFETVKALTEDDGPGTEWSYGFDVEDSEPARKGESPYGDKHRRTLKKLKVHEVSPVLIGAGVGTRVTGIKEKKTFAEQLQDVVASVKAVSERAADVMAMRAEKGKGLGEESLTALKGLKDELEALLKKSEEATDEGDSDLESANAVLRAAFLRFHRDES